MGAAGTGVQQAQGCSRHRGAAGTGVQQAQGCSRHRGVAPSMN